jgi:CspA family cold shock protein
MVTGTVKFFNEKKHFGFIHGDDGKDYFVHSSGLNPGVNIAEGDKVTFDIAETERGPKAEKVQKA